MDWLLDVLEEDEICHVYPEDKRERCTGEDDFTCWCSPALERAPSGAIIVVHNTQSELDDIVAGALRPH